MKIKFKNVIPSYLANIKHDSESIWGNEFELLPGQKVVLNASSGKGKSTFTNILLGVKNDFSGALLFNNKDIRNWNLEKWSDVRKNEISVVFQDLQLFPALTVKENLVLKNNLTETYTENKLLELLTHLGLEDKWEMPCGILSMGQQQRIAIIRALAQPFNWLILDEPFSHLDENNTQLCLKLISDRCNEIKAGFILTTLGDLHGFNYDVELKL
ncbi:MAG: ATP-binding cassette domain-containing protein [Lishizhenia sp.]